MILLIIASFVLFACGHKSGRKGKSDVSKPKDTSLHLEKKESKVPLEKGSVVYAKVVSILDGDTYEAILENKQTIRVRMEGIDAPEKGMPFYQKSKKHLSNLCFGEKVRIEITEIDLYNRLIAYTYLENGQELSHEMIKSGYAWHFKKYNSDTILSKLEIEARNLKKGLWVEKNPMPPWTNRSLHRQGVSTKDSFDIKEFNK